MGRQRITLTSRDKIRILTCSVRFSDRKKSIAVTSTAQAFIQRRLEAIQRRHLLRKLTPLAHGTTPWITIADRKLLNLSSNNYLGLADHPRLKEAAITAIRDY